MALAKLESEFNNWFTFPTGFTEKEFDDVKGIFLDTSIWLFSLTIFISVFHVNMIINGYFWCALA